MPNNYTDTNVSDMIFNVLDSATYEDLSTNNQLNNNQLYLITDDASSGVEYIVGSQEASTYQWLGTSKERNLYIGKVIAYKLPYAGTSHEASLTLTLADNSQTAAIPVKLNNTNVTTHYAAGAVILMVYDGAAWRSTDYWNSNSRDPGYGKITPGAASAAVTGITANTTQVTAKTYNEAITINPGNKWVQLAGSESATAGSDTFTIAHAVQSNVSGNYGDSAAQTPSFGGTFKVPYISVDEAGHISSISDHNVTIPTKPDSAGTADAFSSGTTVKLTGDVTGQSASSTKGWSLSTSIGEGKVTNAMLAGSIENSKLVNSAISIAGNSVSLGGSISAGVLRSSLGLSYAMHFIGKSANAITDGGTQNPGIAGYDFGTNGANAQQGDVIIDPNDSYEYVWTSSNKWERLGPDGSYKVTQTAFTDSTGTAEDTTATRFIYSISQNANGVVSVKTRPLPTYNNYSLPVATSGALGGIKIGYTSANKNYAVQLDSNTNQAYVNVPWTDNNTTYSLTQDNTDGHKITLTPSSGTAQTITIPDSNSWRPIQVNDTEVLTNATNSNALNLKAGSNVTLTNNNGTVTIASSYSNTATAADNILDGSNSGTQITYAPYSTQQTKLSFDTSTSNPSRTDRLNLNGYLYATKLYSGGSEVLTSHQSVTNDNVSVGWNSETTIATIGGTAIKIKIPANPNTNTATAADNILDGSNSGTQITYAPYTAQQSKLSFDTSTTAPSRTDRLNLNGYLYATKLYSNGTEVLTSHQAVSNKNATLAWSTTSTIATIGSTDIKITMPANPNTNTDTLVTQTATDTTNANYELLFSATADNTTRTETARKTSNLIFNPSTGLLTTKNISLTGDLTLTGDAYLNSQTYAEDITTNTLLVNGNANFVAIPTAPTAADGTNNTQLATTAFVYNAFKSNDAMVFKGVVNSNNDLPATHYQGWTYKVGTAGTYAGQTCEIGDTIYCITDGTSANNAHWVVVQNNLSISTAAPSSSSTDGTIPSSKAVWSAISTASGYGKTGTVTSVAVSNGGGLSVSGSPITTSGTITISHADTSSQSDITANGRTYITGVTLDTYGHVTGLTTGSETVTNTHYTANLITGASDSATSNAAATTNGNVYLNLIENSTVRNSHNIVGSGATTVTSDANGKITISSTDTNTDISTLTLASDTGTTNVVSLAHGGKYKLTAGTKSVIFTLPSDNNTNYYHSTGSWSGLTYTATNNGGAPALAFTVPSASTSAAGAVQLNSAVNSSVENQAATPKAVKIAYDLANNHKYWANIEATSAAAYGKAPEMATIKLNGNTSASTASTKNVTLQYDSTLETLNFIFA